MLRLDRALLVPEPREILGGYTYSLLQGNPLASYPLILGTSVKRLQHALALVVADACRGS
jgi:hypothetical protein